MKRFKLVTVGLMVPILITALLPVAGSIRGVRAAAAAPPPPISCSPDFSDTSANNFGTQGSIYAATNGTLTANGDPSATQGLSLCFNGGSWYLYSTNSSGWWSEKQDIPSKQVLADEPNYNSQGEWQQFVVGCVPNQDAFYIRSRENGLYVKAAAYSTLLEAVGNSITTDEFEWYLNDSITNYLKCFP